jgi:hypothetical protein
VHHPIRADAHAGSLAGRDLVQRRNGMESSIWTTRTRGRIRRRIFIGASGYDSSESGKHAPMKSLEHILHKQQDRQAIESAARLRRLVPEIERSLRHAIRET